MSRTVYPLVDASPEHDAGAAGPFLSWSVLCASAGNLLNDAGEDYGLVYFYTGAATTGLWRGLMRSALMFNTSSISASTTILSATLKLRGLAKSGSSLYPTVAPDINIYGATITSDSAIAATDYAVLGSIPYCDTPIAYADWSTTGYNEFKLNTAGLAAINKGGITKFGVRNANYDVAGAAPTWPGSNKSSGLWWYASEYGTATSPLLVITTISTTGTVYYEEGEGLKPTNVITLEAIRNIEMTCMGRFYVDEEGTACYEDRTVRNP